MTHQELRDALDALHAHDVGATDSGVHDEEGLRNQASYTLSRMTEPELSRFLGQELQTRFFREEALDAGYGVADALEFLLWLRGEMGVRL